MTYNSKIEFLKGIELFKSLSDSELETVSNKAEEVKIAANTHLFKENSDRKCIFLIESGCVELYKKSPYGQEKRLSLFRRYDFLGEGTLADDAPHSTNARTLEETLLLTLDKEFFATNGQIAVKVFSQIAKVISRRMRQANNMMISSASQYESGRTRTEHDLLGYREVPDEYYYGIQTLRAIENFNISGITLNFYPDLIQSLAIVKMAAAMANNDLGLMPGNITDAIVQACREIIEGKYHYHFVVDMIQGGAGTSTNMNANEVIANRALEILGHKRGEYEFCHE